MMTKVITSREIHDDWTPERRTAWQAWLVGEEQDLDRVYEVVLNDDNTADYHVFMVGEDGVKIRDPNNHGYLMSIILRNVPIQYECPEAV